MPEDLVGHIVRVKVKEGEGSEALQAFREQVIPIIRQHENYRGHCLLIDVETNAALFVGFWQGQCPGLIPYYQNRRESLGDRFVEFDEMPEDFRVEHLEVYFDRATALPPED